MAKVPADRFRSATDFANALNNLGGLTGNGMPSIQQFYETVDLMLVVGCRLRGHETGDRVLIALRNRIEHVIVIYSENRSFDNLYGLFPGANGIGTAESLEDAIYVARAKTIVREGEIRIESDRVFE